VAITDLTYREKTDNKKDFCRDWGKNGRTDEPRKMDVWPIEKKGVDEKQGKRGMGAGAVWEGKGLLANYRLHPPTEPNAELIRKQEEGFKSAGGVSLNEDLSKKKRRRPKEKKANCLGSRKEPFDEDNARFLLIKRKKSHQKTGERGGRT